MRRERLPAGHRHPHPEPWHRVSLGGWVLGLAAAGFCAWWVLSGESTESSRAAARPASPPRGVLVDQREGRPAARARSRRPLQLVERPTGSLPAALSDAAAVPLPGRALLLGGLTAADTSTDQILSATAGGARPLGRLPGGLHDSAAVRLGRAVYLFGGGDGVSQLATIARIDPATGAVSGVGMLPAPSSDQAAAAVGRTAYVVGGYTGTRWLNTIVAWAPGTPGSVVAHLPFPLRYAAVTAVGGRLVIAGGSLPDGSASDAVLEYVPAAHRVVRLGRLPAPTTHAAAATLGGVAYVVGGRGAALRTPTDRIVAVDPAARRIRIAGRLTAPRSDLAAVTLGRRILLAGGLGRGGTLRGIGELAPATRAFAAASHAFGTNVYAFDGANMLAPAAATARPLVYVPNSESGSVDVIDQSTFKVIDHFQVGTNPQHVTPAYDLKTLYVTNDLSNSLTPIDPQTGTPAGPTIPVDDPYNMYFTPDGRYAIVVAEQLARLDFRDAHSFALHRSVRVPCHGVDHMDFSADGTYLVASCEFSGQLVKVDVASERVVATLRLPDGPFGMPQDVKLSPDGRTFYVADLRANGLWKVDGDTLKVTGFVHTGRGVHGLYPSRDARFLYATNRGEGSISVLSFRTQRVVAKWWIPGGGSPDMGGVSADGRVLWVTGRYDAVVYAISTRNGHLLAKIPVGLGPHGLCVWPQPGRYSLGHTGILR